MIKYLLIYFAIISLISVILTVIDKIKAKLHSRRIAEDLLMTVGLIGGALFEYLTMNLIHHKTKHKKFMVGLPVMIIFHIVIILIVLYIQRG